MNELTNREKPRWKFKKWKALQKVCVCNLNSHEEVRAVPPLKTVIPESLAGIFNPLKLFWASKLWIELPHLPSQVIVHTLQPLITAFSNCLCSYLQLPHFDFCVSWWSVLKKVRIFFLRAWFLIGEIGHWIFSEKEKSRKFMFFNLQLGFLSKRRKLVIGHWNFVSCQLRLEKKKMKREGSAWFSHLWDLATTNEIISWRWLFLPMSTSIIVGLYRNNRWLFFRRFGALGGKEVLRSFRN